MDGVVGRIGLWGPLRAQGLASHRENVKSRPHSTGCTSTSGALPPGAGVASPVVPGPLNAASIGAATPQLPRRPHPAQPGCLFKCMTLPSPSPPPQEAGPQDDRRLRRAVGRAPRDGGAAAHSRLRGGAAAGDAGGGAQGLRLSGAGGTARRDAAAAGGAEVWARVFPEHSCAASGGAWRRLGPLQGGLANGAVAAGRPRGHRTP